MNSTTNLFQTVLAASSAAAESLRFRNVFADAIYVDYQPVVATPYTVLNVIIPTVNEGAVVDIQSGPIQPTDYSYNPTSITLNRNFSVSLVVKDWDKVRTPADLQRIFIQPMLEGLLRKINRTIVGLFNATNFPNYTLFTGATNTVAGDFARADIGTAWQNLVNAGVPVDTDPENVRLLVNPLSYAAMLSDQNFIYQYIVGDNAAVQAQQRAKLSAIFGAQVDYDQMLVPFNAGHQPAILMHKYAVAAVTANPPPGGSNVMETYINLKGFPVQIQFAYSMQDQGWVIHAHCMWGVAVVRPEMASLFQSYE